MRPRLLPAALLLLAACAAANQPPAPGRPSIDVRQQTALFFGSSQTAPLNLDFDITNTAKEPILIKRIRVQAGPGMMQYSVYPAERYVNETIAPGETKTIYVTATAYTDRTRLDATEPLGLRTTLDYESEGKRHQELYVLLNVNL
ncbi:MAG TPA: hypothetical protein VJZ00_02575 [Thermoanaerobaculia bacterium]|nr:hypothetical protein [Thermoanaerobaculia bacterium]